MAGSVNPEAVLAGLAGRFVYERDGALDSWHIMRPDAFGRLRGDCDDFAITLAWRLAGGSAWRLVWHLVTLKTVIWYCTSTSGGPHAVLWHRGAGWADNFFPAWAPRTRHVRRFPWPVPLVGLKLLVGVFVRH